jgi:fructuronate reductase
MVRRAVERPGYALAGSPPGIVHFGPGAFHRAHQAAYVDAILAEDPRWAISAVALNSTAVADALRPQDGLYALALLGETPRYRIIGSLRELLVGRQLDKILDRIAAPTTRLITSTVTEKGYCLTNDGGLDLDHAGIRADLSDPGRPRTFIGWLARGLSHRRERGQGWLTILSCDNLQGNGDRLARAVHAFARIAEPDLAGWIEDEVRFPNSMVDSITPATDDVLRARATQALGLEDAWPVQREEFAQWVIEDDFRGERPPLDRAGAQFVRSVTAFEEAKLRLLNGAHSTLAYLGSLLGHESVADAMADPILAGFVERLMRDDIAPVVAPLEGQPVPDYISAILDRFRNGAIRHLLSQIAWDGSQKLPVRLLGTMLDRRRAGLPIGRLAIPVAAWLRFLALPRRPADPIVDPLSEALLPLARSGDVDGLLGLRAVFPRALSEDPLFRDAVRTAHMRLDHPANIGRLLRDGENTQ